MFPQSRESQLVLDGKSRKFSVSVANQDHKPSNQATLIYGLPVAEADLEESETCKVKPVWTSTEALAAGILPFAPLSVRTQSRPALP